ncbi:MAG: hypothetical protein WAX14_10090 [Rhodococcus sp. (in: high G+C Gram-positive bacteria)]|uniref:hypothetical protein n=1 Tax=Rhodococcus sp. TaxID=1831 RepID=UPI003BB75394
MTFEIHDSARLPVARVEEFYDAVLAPSFVESELIPRAELLAELSDPRGETVASLALDDAGEIVGGAVGQWFPQCRVMLTAYLATRPGRRGWGIGGAILRAVVEDWRRRVDPLLIVGEVEDPRHHTDIGFGDPERRLKFYAAAGAKIVPVPYFQPAIHTDSGRVPHLFLMTFAVSGECRRGEHRIDAAPIRAFLLANLVGNEGRVDPDDPATAALLDAASTPTIELVDPQHYPNGR